MKKCVDENGIEWTVIGTYQLAAIGGAVVVKAAPGEDDATAQANFAGDMGALARAGLVALSSDTEDGQ